MYWEFLPQGSETFKRHWPKERSLGCQGHFPLEGILVSRREGSKAWARCQVSLCLSISKCDPFPLSPLIHHEAPSEPCCVNLQFLELHGPMSRNRDFGTAVSSKLAVQVKVTCYKENKSNTMGLLGNKCGFQSQRVSIQPLVSRLSFAFSLCIYSWVKCTVFSFALLCFERRSRYLTQARLRTDYGVRSQAYRLLIPASPVFFFSGGPTYKYLILVCFWLWFG